jgi:hypothetical protein
LAVKAVVKLVLVILTDFGFTSKIEGFGKENVKLV